MSKIELDDNVVNNIKAVEAFNRNFQKLNVEFQDKVLYRDNPEGEPNSMNNPLDMSGNRIYNLPKPLSNHEPLRRGDIDDIDQAMQDARDAAQEARDSADNADSSASNADRAAQEARDEIVYVENRFQEFLLNSGYEDLGDYKSGIFIINRNQVFNKDGELYRASAILDLPYVTSGDWQTEQSFFVTVGDAVLRQELSNNLGSNLVGFQQNSDNAVYRSAFEKFEEFVSIKDFGAVGDGVADDTESLRKAVEFAANNKKKLHLDGLRLRITDTINITFGARKLIIDGNWGNIIFDNSVQDKALFNLASNSGYTLIERVGMQDTNPGTSCAIRLAGYPLGPGGPNWKNRFDSLRIDNFKLGLNLTTDGDENDHTKQDWAAETMFLHSKFKNCRTGIRLANLQSLNNLFYQTDIENDAPGNEDWPLIVTRTGGELVFHGCSLIGKGRLLEVGNQFVPSVHTAIGGIQFVSCRLEVRAGHKGELIYQVPPVHSATTNLSSITIKDCMAEVWDSSVDLIKAVNLDLAVDNLRVKGGSGALKIRTYSVDALSGNSAVGYRGLITVNDSSSTELIQDSGTDYGTFNRNFPSKVTITNTKTNSNGSYIIDSNGFLTLIASAQKQLAYGLQYAGTEKLIFNSPPPTSGFKSVKFILPKYARPMKFGVWKQPVRLTEATQYKLYIVKDVSLWATPGVFNVATDAYLVADTGSTINKAGLFEVPIILTTSALGSDMSSGLGTGWVEGRMYAEHSGAPNALGGFIYVEYM